MGSVQPPDTSSETSTAQLNEMLDEAMQRLDTFEQTLREAMRVEHAFRNNLLTITDALDSFAETHHQEDLHLSRLIEEDTQRAREAKEEYEALAARFDETLRPNRSGRHMELLKTISLYISIVISVVFMAPLHAILSIFEKLFRKIGLAASDFYGRRERTNSSTTYRDRQNLRQDSSAARFSSSLRQGQNIIPGKKKQSKESGAAGAPSQGPFPALERIPEETAILDGLNDPQESSPRDRSDSNANLTSFTPASSFDAGPSRKASTIKLRKGRTTERRSWTDQGNGLASSSSGSEDEFVDALGEADVDTGVEGNGDGSVSVHSDSERSKHGSEENQSRPDWACPLDSSGQSSQEKVLTFPSSDFWNISEEDIRMDFLRKG